MESFAPQQLAYLRTQRLGRLATVDPGGTPQNSPVGFLIDPDDIVRIGGLNLGQSRKFRNVREHGRVSLVVDDIASVDPWHVRGVEIRGAAEALLDVDALRCRGMSREEIRIRPERIVSWDLESVRTS